MKIGDLVKFDYVNGYTSHTNNKVAVYLGDRLHHREDGTTVNNFEVHIIGEDWPSLCDGSMKRWLRLVEG
jgi:hypothetical protein